MRNDPCFCVKHRGQLKNLPTMGQGNIPAKSEIIGTYSYVRAN